MKAGIVQLDWSFIFQFINIVLLGGLIYLIVNLIYNLHKRTKKTAEKIQCIENTLEDINKN